MSDNRTTVDSGALTMALNVLRRAGRTEVADALEATAIRGAESKPVQAEAPTASNERERLIGKLRACVADPMWANHAEISKLTLLQVIAALPTQPTASNAGERK